MATGTAAMTAPAKPAPAKPQAPDNPAHGETATADARQSTAGKIAKAGVQLLASAQAASQKAALAKAAAQASDQASAKLGPSVTFTPDDKRTRSAGDTQDSDHSNSDTKGSGAAAAGAAIADKIPPIGKLEPKPQPPIDEALDAARNHQPSPEQLKEVPPAARNDLYEQYRAEQSVMYDEIATRLEQQSAPSGSAGDVYADQLEEAQQGAKRERERRMREELAQTPAGREMLEFERLAGVPITIWTDREWEANDANPNAAAFSRGDDGLFFKVRHTNAHVYTHEMTHQVDHRTRILVRDENDTRSKEQVIAEATANYERFGLDPTEVQVVVDATYGQPNWGHSLTHAHTRLAEARLHRQEAGGAPLTEDEMREVMELSLPREQDIFWAQWAVGDDNDGFVKNVQFRAYAQSRGVTLDGRSNEQIAQDLQQIADAAEQQIVSIERR